MATRAFIAKAEDDGSVRGIYCHFDGYPSAAGRTLNDFYGDEVSVDKLLALGDISTLGADTDSTVAYHRDRGEALTPNHKYKDAEAMVARAATDMGVQFAYVWSDGAWETYRI